MAGAITENVTDSVVLAVCSLPYFGACCLLPTTYCFTAFGCDSDGEAVLRGDKVTQGAWRREHRAGMTTLEDSRCQMERASDHGLCAVNTSLLHALDHEPRTQNHEPIRDAGCKALEVILNRVLSIQHRLYLLRALTTNPEC